jgi:hypothetical protein
MLIVKLQKENNRPTSYLWIVMQKHFLKYVQIESNNIFKSLNIS